MPNISKRSQGTYESPIRKLAPSANRAEAAGKRVYYLNIGQPDIPTPPTAMQAVRDANIEVLKYAPSKGVHSYINKLATFYQSKGHAIDGEHIFVTNGASEAVQLLLVACLDFTDNVLIPEPLYANYVGFAEYANVQVKALTSHIDNGFALPDIAAFEGAIDKKTRAILICNPNNPTGAVYTKEVIFELGELCKKNDLFLFVDEVYSEFCYDEHEFFSALELKGLEQHVAIVDSVSKRFSACGARVGNIVSRNTEILDAVNKFAQFRLSAPTMGQILAEALLDVTPEYLAETKREYARRRAVLYNRLKNMEDVICYEPGGAFYVFAQLPIDNADRFCKWLLEDFDHEGQTLMLAPGSGFYATTGLGENQIRIAYVLNTVDLHRAMDCLEQALKVYPNRTTKNVARTFLSE